MQVIVDKGKYVLLKTGFYIKSNHRLIYDNDKSTCHFHNKHLISSENKNVLKPRNSSMWRHTIHKLYTNKVMSILARYSEPILEHKVSERSPVGIEHYTGVLYDVCRPVRVRPPLRVRDLWTVVMVEVRHVAGVAGMDVHPVPHVMWSAGETHTGIPRDVKLMQS